jgi:hypothetical protein
LPVKARHCLNPRFVSAVCASPITNLELSKLAGFSQPQIFSSMLHGQWVSASTKTLARLRIVATLIGFPEKDIFLEECPAVSADAFTLDTLPGPGPLFRPDEPEEAA